MRLCVRVSADRVRLPMMAYFIDLNPWLSQSIHGGTLIGVVPIQTVSSGEGSYDQFFDK